MLMAEQVRELQFLIPKVQIGNTAFFETADIIHYDKMREMGECVAPILRFQKTPYEFQPIPVIQHLFLAGAPGHNAQSSSLLLSLAYPQYMNLNEDELQEISERLE
jgi:hypothetical protein